MRNAILKSCLLGLVVATLLVTPAIAQSTRFDRVPSTEYVLPTDAEIAAIVATASDILGGIPSRARVATIEDANSRLFLTKVLDHVEAAQGADRMTAKELQAFAEDVQATAASAQVGIGVCAAPVDVIATEAAAGSGVRFGLNDSVAQVVAAECSCVQTCYNEWRANLRTCNGGYWCQVGYNLLFELCLADCLIPG